MERLQELLPYLAQYGYWIVFGAVLLEFAFVIPLFSTLMLLAAGILVHLHLLHALGVILSAVMAMLIGDTLWYRIGQRRGRSFLRAYCRLTLGSGQCVERTEGFFERHGSKALLVAKFIAGFSTFAAPMAGWRRMPFLKFVSYDALGSMLWSTMVVSLGTLFADEIESSVLFLMRFNQGIAMALLAVFAGYLVMKVIKRRRFGSGQPFFSSKQE